MSNEEKKKKKQKSPQIPIDWKEVERLACKFSKGKEIASRLAISYRRLIDRFMEEHEPTLEENFSNFSSFLTYKRRETLSKLKETAIENAMTPLGVTDRIFLLKALCGLSDKPKQDKEQNNMPNITVNFTPPIQKDSGDDWDDE